MEKSKEIYLFHQGTYYHAYNLLGCHPEEGGAWFRVWAPNAAAVSVCGDFNGWNTSANQMRKIDNSSIWEVYIENTKQYDNYKYFITTADDRTLYKADPYAIHSETRPGTASKIFKSKYKWRDSKWLEERKKTSIYKSPVNIYEMHLGSWKQYDDGNFLSYRD